MSNSAWVFAGGQFNRTDIDTLHIKPEDLVVGVDRGIEHCLAMDLVPNVLIGDFDSVDESLLSDSRLHESDVVRHPARKDHSDLDLALMWLSNASVDRVVLLGVSGGRSDHHLFNWLLPMHKPWPYAIEMLDASVHAHLVNSAYPLDATVYPGQIVSALALPDATGVTTRGLEYALDNATLVAGSTLGLSNVAVSSGIQISVATGQLLVCLVRADYQSDSR